MVPAKSKGYAAFTRSERLPRSSLILRILKNGKKITRDCIAVYFAKRAVAEEDIHWARFAIVVRKKSCKSAVGRNRLKRLAREMFRLHKQQLPPLLDIVAVVQGPCQKVSNSDFRLFMGRALKWLASSDEKGYHISYKNI